MRFRPFLAGGGCINTAVYKKGTEGNIQNPVHDNVCKRQEVNGLLVAVNNERKTTPAVTFNLDETR